MRGILKNESPSKYSFCAETDLSEIYVREEEENKNKLMMLPLK
jgi:hypothetical protein